MQTSNRNLESALLVGSFLLALLWLSGLLNLIQSEGWAWYQWLKQPIQWLILSLFCLMIVGVAMWLWRNLSHHQQSRALELETLGQARAKTREMELRNQYLSDELQARTAMLVAEVRQKSHAVTALPRGHMAVVADLSQHNWLATMQTIHPLLSDSASAPSSTVTKPLGDTSMFDFDPDWVPRVFNPQMTHNMIVGERNSGKTTLVNHLLSLWPNYWDDCHITLIDPVFHWGRTGWLFPDGLPITVVKPSTPEEFFEHLTDFHAGCQTEIEKVFEPISQRRNLLIVDETPRMLNGMQVYAKKTKQNWMYYDTMQMLRDIYTGGHHVGFTLLLLTQSQLVKTLDIDTSDQNNFTNTVLGIEIKPFLGRAATGLRSEREQCQSSYHILEQQGIKYKAAIKSSAGVEVQPLPDLSAFGAKRFHHAEDSATIPDHVTVITNGREVSYGAPLAGPPLVIDQVEDSPYGPPPAMSMGDSLTAVILNTVTEQPGLNLNQLVTAVRDILPDVGIVRIKSQANALAHDGPLITESKGRGHPKQFYALG